MQYISRSRDGKGFCIELDVSDLKIPKIEKITPLLSFDTNTYNKLEREGGDKVVWDMAFGPINKFFNILSKDDQTAIAMLIIKLHHDLLEYMEKGDVHTLPRFINDASKEINDLDTELDICGKIKSFVQTYVPLGDFSKAGQRAQDREELTFHIPEVLDLLTITLFCKLLAPIFGVAITSFKGSIGGKRKEVLCSIYMNMLLRKRYQPLITKLRNYIKHHVKNTFEESDSCVFQGWSYESLSNHVFSSLLVRNFVNVNLYFDGGNIMKYIMVITKKIVNSKSKEVLSSPVRHRIEQVSNDREEGNITQLEIDSVTSSKTCDIEPIVVSYVDKVLILISNSYELDTAEYKSILNFYKSNQVIPTMFNQVLVCGFYGKHFGGSKSILLMRRENYTKLLIQLSCIAFSMGYVEIGHMLTALPTHNIKVSFTPSDNLLQMNFSSSYAYRNCREKFDQTLSGCGAKEWDMHIKELVNNILSCYYVYNTAVSIWDDLNTENLNKKRIITSPKLIEDMCSFIETTGIVA